MRPCVLTLVATCVAVSLLVRLPSLSPPEHTLRFFLFLCLLSWSSAWLHPSFWSPSFVLRSSVTSVSSLPVSATLTWWSRFLPLFSFLFLDLFLSVLVFFPPFAFCSCFFFLSFMDLRVLLLDGQIGVFSSFLFPLFSSGHFSFSLVFLHVLGSTPLCCCFLHRFWICVSSSPVGSARFLPSSFRCSPPVVLVLPLGFSPFMDLRFCALIFFRFWICTFSFSAVESSLVLPSSVALVLLASLYTAFTQRSLFIPLFFCFFGSCLCRGLVFP